MDKHTDPKAADSKATKPMPKKDAMPDKGAMAKDKDAMAKKAGGHSEQSGEPGMNVNAEYVVKQHDDLHIDASKEMRDQLTGAAGGDAKAGTEQKQKNPTAKNSEFEAKGKTKH